jgi:hypothetical protein
MYKLTFILVGGCVSTQATLSDTVSDIFPKPAVKCPILPVVERLVARITTEDGAKVIVLPRADV